MTGKGKAVFLAAAMALLSACGGGDGDDDDDDVSVTDPGGGTSTDASADAGLDQLVASGDTVTLGGIAGGDGTLTISWVQTDGPAVTITDGATENPTFTAPNLTSSDVLTFELTVDNGSSTATDMVSVEVFVAPDATTDKTVLGDFTGHTGWACTVDPAFTPSVSITETGGKRLFSGNGIARHTTGTFPNNGNPNSIDEFTVSHEMTLSPTLAGTVTEMAEFGVTLDGVILERDTAEYYNNGTVWNYEAVTPAIADGTTSAIVANWLGTDCSNAHVQPNGRYHYHGLMEGLLNVLGENPSGASDMILGGYAADGFPFYLRYGYVDASDTSSGLKVMEASWELKSGTRPSGPGGSYDGTFRQDWEYVAASGDLDECGGRFGPTPEYPGGIYHYYVTDDYPYIPRCVSGTPDASFRKSAGTT